MGYRQRVEGVFWREVSVNNSSTAVWAEAEVVANEGAAALQARSMSMWQRRLRCIHTMPTEPTDRWTLELHVGRREPTGQNGAEQRGWPERCVEPDI